MKLSATMLDALATIAQRSANEGAEDGWAPTVAHEGTRIALERRGLAEFDHRGRLALDIYARLTQKGRAELAGRAR